MPVSYPIFNTDPNLQSQAALLDQRQMMAQALLQRGFTPMQGRMAGDVYVGPHPLEAIGNLVSAWQGNKAMQQVAQDRASLAAQAYAAQLKANEPQRPPSFTQPQVSSTASNALSGGGGPTNANAQKMAQMLVGQQPADPGAPPNPRNPLNMPAELVTGYQANYIPKEVFETQAALFKPTDATIQARQGGLDPTQANQQAFAKTVTDPEILKLQQAGFTQQQISAYMQAKATKDTFIPPIDAKPGTPLIDALSHKVIAFAPKMADGLNATFGDVNGVTTPIRSNAIPGYAQANASIAGAQAGAVADNGIITVQTPTGETVPVRAGPAAAVGGAQLGIRPGRVGSPEANAQGYTPESLRILKEERAKPGNSPEDIAGIDREIARIQGRVKIGQSTTNAGIQKDSASAITNAPQIAQQSKSAITGLETALQQIEAGIKTGPGTAKTVNAVALLNNLGVPLMKDDVTGYQTLQKYLQNALNQAAQGTGASGSDARFESFMHGQPNAETMNPEALRGAIRYVLSQHDAALARSQMLPKEYQAANQAGDPNAAVTAQEKWSRAYNPDFFAFNRMDPKEQTQFLRGKGAKAADFVKQYNDYAAKTGWVH